jgi:hypothetical protein
MMTLYHMIGYYFSKNKSHKKDRHKISAPADPDSSSIPQSLDLMSATIESAVPEILAHFSQPDEDTDSEDDMTPPLGPANSVGIRHRLSDHSRDSLSSEAGANVSAIYTGMQ